MLTLMSMRVKSISHTDTSIPSKCFCNGTTHTLLSAFMLCDLNLVDIKAVWWASLVSTKMSQWPEFVHVNLTCWTLTPNCKAQHAILDIML